MTPATLSIQDSLLQFTPEDAAKHRINLNDLLIHWLTTQSEDERTPSIVNTHAEINDLLRLAFD